MNLKSGLTGFIAGVTICSCVAAFAASMDVSENTYPITLNGESISLEGYNIEGSTYFKLRDVGDATGFDVDFQNDTIVLTSQKGGQGGGQRPDGEMPDGTPGPMGSGQMGEAPTGEPPADAPEIPADTTEE